MSHIADQESASAKLTGTVGCMNEAMKELKKCQLCKAHIQSLVIKAIGLLESKEAILLSQLKSLQEFRGSKRKGESLFGEDDKRSKIHDETEFELHLKGYA